MRRRYLVSVPGFLSAQLCEEVPVNQDVSVMFYTGRINGIAANVKNIAAFKWSASTLGGFS